MIVVDIGNTKTLLGFVDQGKIQKTWKMTTHKNLMADEYIAHFNNFLSQIETTWEKNPICVASVVPHITEQLKTTAKNRSDVHFVSSESPVDFTIELPNPRVLGADLIAAGQGAILKYKTPLIIVDAGTATTLMMINEKNQFIGGAICPGIGISSQALFSQAAALAPIQLTVPEEVIGNATNNAILSGVCFGHASMIEKMIERFEKHLGKTCTVVTTGGAMELLAKILPEQYVYQPTVTLLGLISIYEKSRGDT